MFDEICKISPIDLNELLLIPPRPPLNVAFAQVKFSNLLLIGPNFELNVVVRKLIFG